MEIMVFLLNINNLSAPPPDVTDASVTLSGQGWVDTFLSGIPAVIFFAVLLLSISLYFKIRRIAYRHFLPKRFLLFHSPASAQALRGRFRVSDFDRFLSQI